MWIYNNQLFTSDMIKDSIGFVYKITCIPTNRQYIGKKLFYFTKTSIKTITLKSGIKKKKKIKSLIESDWQSYYGSNSELQNDVINLGENFFEKHILHLCNTRGVLSYLELKEQVLRGVLEHPELFYNGIIQVKIHRNHIKPLFQ